MPLGHAELLSLLALAGGGPASASAAGGGADCNALGFVSARTALETSVWSVTSGGAPSSGRPAQAAMAHRNNGAIENSVRASARKRSFYNASVGTTKQHARPPVQVTSLPLLAQSVRCARRLRAHFTQ